MSGKISLKNQLIEEWMEIKAFYANNRNDNEALQVDLLRNRDLDFKNDEYQKEGMKHLEAVVSCLNVNDYCGASKHAIAAIQWFTKAQVVDYSDDKPRNDAMAKIAKYIEKSLRKEEVIRIKVKESPDLDVWRGK